MPVTINGTTGIAGVDGSAGTPAVQGGDSNTGIFFPAADTIAFAEGGAEVMRIDSAGNVGIGTSSPAAGFGSGKTIEATGPLVVGGSINAHQTSRGVFQYSGNETTIRSYGATAGSGQIVFTTGGGGSADTERARIDSSGNLLVGTTNSNSSAFKLKVQAATDVCLGVASGTNIAGAMTLNAVNDANSANIALDFRSSSIYVSSGIGTTAAAANAYFDSGNSNRFLRSTSALKYKTNIRDLESIDITKFRAVRYNSLCEADDPNKEHFGLIADEVHAAGITELVSYGADGEVEGFQYDRLTVVLVKAIQEQQALIESLTARIAALEAA